MVLEARMLVKHYGKRRVVDRLSLHVRAGEVVGLLGPNGAGKTTTFFMMMGFVNADEGKVLLEGKDISSLPFYSRARLGIGYLPQEPSVFTRASVEENLNIALECWVKPTQHDSVRESLLEEFHLSSIRTQPTSTLSSGERRRLEIARTLATSPSFMLLDEPFSGIDPLSVNELQTQIRKLKERRIGAIITDHNVRDTLSITDHTYLIHEGRVITSGTPEEIVEDPVARRYYFGEHFKG